VTFRRGRLRTAREVRMTSRCSAVLLALATTAGVLVAPPAARAQYAGSSSITHWNGGCGGSTRTWWDDMCMAWRKKMGDKGWIQWWRNYELVTGGRYVDPIERPWGFDNSSAGLDWNDAGLVCTHGGWGSGRWTGTLYDPDPDGACSMTSSRMRLGRTASGW